jgi:hypothetical protein
MREKLVGGGGLKGNWLTQEELEDFALLAPKGILSGLSVAGSPKYSLKTKSYAIGKRLAILPVGLLLVRVEGRPWNRYAEILLLTVSAPFWKRGIATEMMHECINGLNRAGVKVISVSYPIGTASEIAMTKLTHESKGWRYGIVTSLYSTGEHGAEAFVERYQPTSTQLAVRNKIEIAGYNSCSPREIKKAMNDLRPPEWALLPARESEGNSGAWGSFNPLTSVILRRRNEIIGWSVCHKTGDNIHRITVAYVSKELQKNGTLLIAIVASVQSILQQHRGIASASLNIRFGVFSTNIGMMNFTRRKIEEFMAIHHDSQEKMITNFSYYIRR